MKSPAARSPGVTGLTNDGVFSDTLDLALKLHPSVREVLVVARSRNVAGYDRRVRSALERFARRVSLTYVPQQSLSGLLAAVRAAPSNSLILFGRFIPDGSGSNMHSGEVLRRMAEVSTVPIYATSDLYVGTGIVGGMTQSSRSTGRRLGAIVRQILDGVPPDRIPIESLPLEPTFDWRQLQRWKIDTASLPPGSDVRFRALTIWEEYRSYIVGTLAVVIVQAVLITGLLTQRARRRRAEQTIRAREATLRESYERIRQMAGRLINAQEAARAGVAQDLHDDVCQQLVFVSMGVSTLKSSSGELQDGKTQEALTTLEADTQKVFEGLRRLSHDLHPATLRLLGLTAALRTHCVETAKHHGVDVAFKADAVPAGVHKDVAVCFFRIAQEALRNGIAHGGARRLSVSLAGAGEHLDLVVTDDGAGFDVASAYRDGGGLGLVTMSERARVVGATVDISSQPARGTTVRVRGPAGLSGSATLTDAPAHARRGTPRKSPETEGFPCPAESACRGCPAGRRIRTSRVGGGSGVSGHTYGLAALWRLTAKLAARCQETSRAHGSCWPTTTMRCSSRCVACSLRPATWSAASPMASRSWTPPTRLRPDVTVLDLNLPTINGLEACRRIKAALPLSKVILITAADDDALRKTAFELGASAFVLKHRVVDDLGPAIQEAFQGNAGTRAV